MELPLTLQAALIVVAHLFAGAMVQAWLCGRAESVAARVASSILLGPAILCVELLVLGACFGSVSYELLVLPWILGGFAWLLRGCVRGTIELRFSHLLGLACALLFIEGAMSLSIPPTHGDPGSNFAGFARLYAHLGRVDPVAAEGLSILGHFEYPPLLAANESLFFQLDDETGARLLGVLFPVYLVALLLLAWSVLAEGASSRVKLVGAALLLLLALQPSTVEFATYGYAELPLVAALLWMLIELGSVLERGEGGRRKYAGLLLAGLTLALTKQEGILLAIGIAAVAPAVHGLRATWVPIAVAAMASAWPLLILSLGLDSGWLSDILGDFSFEKLARVPRAAQALFLETFAYASYPGSGFASFAIVTVLLALVRRVQGAPSRRARLALIGLALHFFVYALVFTLTAEEFEWHLHTASGRLAFHFLPHFILLARR